MLRSFFMPLLCLFLINPGQQIKEPVCSCNYMGAFLKVAPPSKLIAVVKVSKYLTFKDIYGKKTPMSMEVEVIDVYKGAEERKTFTVWGDPGNLCRPYLSTFKEGGYYLIAFYPVGEKQPDYEISICGAYWLNVDNEKQTATGDINIGTETAKQTMSLSELKNELLKN